MGKRECSQGLKTEKWSGPDPALYPGNHPVSGFHTGNLRLLWSGGAFGEIGLAKWESVRAEAEGTMEAMIVDDKFPGFENEIFHCFIRAEASEDTPRIDITVWIKNINRGEILCEFKVVASTNSPLVYDGNVRAIGHYGICVGLNVVGAATRIISREYHRSSARGPSDKAEVHVWNAFKALLERKVEVRDETAKALVTCAAALLP